MDSPMTGAGRFCPVHLRAGRRLRCGVVVRVAWILRLTFARARTSLFRAAELPGVSHILVSRGHTYEVAGCQMEACDLLVAGDYTYVILALAIPTRSKRSKPRLQNGMYLLEEIVSSGTGHAATISAKSGGISGVFWGLFSARCKCAEGAVGEASKALSLQGLRPEGG